MASDELAEAIGEALGDWWNDQSTPLEQGLATWLRSPEGRAVVARALGLERPEDTLWDAIDHLTRHYLDFEWGKRAIAELEKLAAERTGDGDEH